MRIVSMRLVDLTDEVLREIIELYDEVVGGNGLRYFDSGTLQYAKELLEKRSSVEWRFGSCLSGHSKLWIQRNWRGKSSDQLIYFSCGANVDMESAKIRKEVKKIETNFNDAVSEFLRAKGLAVSGQDS